MVPTASGMTVRGIVINAVNNEPIHGVKVTVEVGNVLGSAVTDERGDFDVRAVPVGRASVEFSHDDYEALAFGLDTDNNSTLRVVLSPKLPAGEARIVLIWETRPRDLDGHLFGTDSSGSRFHLSVKNPKVKGATLDVDAKEGLGPETITLKVLPGTYQYFIVHPEKVGTSDGQGLGSSRAQVRLYYARQVAQLYAVPPNALGPVWHAFDMRVDDNHQITVAPANRWLETVPTP